MCNLFLENKYPVQGSQHSLLVLWKNVTPSVEQGFGFLRGSQSDLSTNNMNQRSILVQFPPWVRRCLTSLHDRQLVQHGCYGNCSSFGFAAAAIVIAVLLRKQSEVCLSTRDVKKKKAARRGSATTVQCVLFKRFTVERWRLKNLYLSNWASQLSSLKLVRLGV